MATIFAGRNGLIAAEKVVFYHLHAVILRITLLSRWQLNNNFRLEKLTHMPAFRHMKE